jgi:hypothetical protein
MSCERQLLVLLLKSFTAAAAAAAACWSSSARCCILICIISVELVSLSLSETAACHMLLLAVGGEWTDGLMAKSCGTAETKQTSLIGWLMAVDELM